jgi:hypothetical protein
MTIVVEVDNLRSSCNKLRSAAAREIFVLGTIEPKDTSDVAESKMVRNSLVLLTNERAACQRHANLFPAEPLRFFSYCLARAESDLIALPPAHRSNSVSVPCRIAEELDH